MNVTQAITRFQNKNDLTEDESFSVFESIFSADTPDEHIRDLLVAWYQKKEVAAEIVGAVKFLRTQMKVFNTQISPIMDCCGTGGDGKGTFNFSTATAFILAASGLAVAKHGNRAMSSDCGSSDIIAALGLPQNTLEDVAQQCLQNHRLVFLHAPLFHPILARVAPIRKSLGHRSIFNLLGPLLNPAGPSIQMVGVSELPLVEIYTQVISQLGIKRATVVHSLDGLDEFSLTTTARVGTVIDGTIRLFDFDPKISGYSYCQLAYLKGGAPDANAKRLILCLKGHSQPLDHVVHINAAWGLMTAGVHDHFLDALLHVQDVISSGLAFQKLVELQNYFKKAASS